MGGLKVLSIWKSDILQQGNDKCAKGIACLGRQAGQDGSDEFDVDALLWDLSHIRFYKF